MAQSGRCPGGAAREGHAGGRPLEPLRRQPRLHQAVQRLQRIVPPHVQHVHDRSVPAARREGAQHHRLLWGRGPFRADARHAGCRRGHGPEGGGRRELEAVVHPHAGQRRRAARGEEPLLGPGAAGARDGGPAGGVRAGVRWAHVCHGARRRAHGASVQTDRRPAPLQHGRAEPPLVSAPARGRDCRGYRCAVLWGCHSAGRAREVGRGGPERGVCGRQGLAECSLETLSASVSPLPAWGYLAFRVHPHLKVDTAGDRTG
mmetsp:Transcript_14869/g.42299  ORF Transcript_14869/g.42299 Transcript_14869/m.42299 type:complete len:260 (+) Transcript_14869:901-1680(+)